MKIIEGVLLMKIKIDFVAPPFSGHLYPMIELAMPLLEKEKYEIRFITGPKKIPLLEELGFKTEPLLSEQPEVMEKISNIRRSMFSLLKQLKQNIALFPKLKMEIENLILNNKTDIVVADFVAIHAGVVCDKYNIPWITTIPTPFAIENRTGTPGYFGGLINSDKIIFKVRDYLARKLALLVKKMIWLINIKTFKKFNLKIYRSDGTETIYSNYSILGLGMEEFEFKRDWPKSFKFIGPCCNSPEKPIKLNIPFEKYKNAALISIGTHLNWAKEKIKEDIKYLSDKFPDILFIISMGNSNSGINEPIFTDRNRMIFEYIPYSQYFDRFTFIIHHGGAGITYNCIKYMKPSIVVPHDFDQFDFAARVEYRKIGKRIKKIKSYHAIRAIKQILAGEYETNIRKINEDYQRYNTVNEFENEIQRVLKGRE